MELPSVSDRIIDRADPTSLTITAIFTLTILLVALLGTWNFIPLRISDFTLGVLMLFGGSMMFAETYIQGKRGINNSSDVIGIITSILATLYGIGLVAQINFLQNHFNGPQGGIILFLFVNLSYELFYDDS